MGFKKSDITPAMLARMDEAARKYYEQGGMETHIRYQQEMPWVDRKLAGRVGRLEREEQGTFGQWLNQNGWKDCYCWHGLHKATTCKAGVPDFIVPVNGNTLYIEFKAAGGKLSIPQQNYEIGLEHQFIKLHIVYTALEAINLVKSAQNEPGKIFSHIEFHPSGCWNWTASQRGSGYGQFKVNGRMRSAHKVFWEYLHGPLKPGIELHHTCLNKICVKPEHVIPLTRREHIMQPNGIAYLKSQKTYCANGHEFTPENTYVRKEGRRICKECNRAGCKKQYHKRKENKQPQD